MEPKQFRLRLISIGALFALCLIVFFFTMFDAQIVHGQEYRDRSVRTNTTTETVEASRGIITDRNGKVLISNLPIYTLEFDPSHIDPEELNATVSRLLDLLNARGVAHDDLLAMTATAPFSYDFESRSGRALLDFLKSRNWVAESAGTDELASLLPASALFARLRDYYDVDTDLGYEQARELVGFRYSLDLTKLGGGSTFLFASDVDVELISILKDGQFPGVRVGRSSKRVYETDAAAHILGRVTKIPAEWLDSYLEKGYAMNDLIGRDGVEYAFEDYLRGTDGKRVVTMNDSGKVTSELYSVEPHPGSTVALTLDIDFQQQVENILRDTTDGMTATDGIPRGAAAAVVQVGTGEVLCLASYPTYSLKEFNEHFSEWNSDPLSPMLNRATMGTYPPGSTFKPLTAIAALETGIITPKTKIRDLGQYHYFDMTYNCWIYSTSRSTHGLINVTEAIKVSCNYFFYDVGRMTGIATLERYAAAFGLGQPTGIELPENTGTMTSPDYVNSLEGHYWTDGLTLQAAIGQAYDLFTPLQLSNYIATLVGGGTRYNAHLLKDVREAGSPIPIYSYDEPPADIIPMEEQNLSAVLEGMHQLVQSGSISRYFKDCVVDAGAKTGTAQTGGRGTTSNGMFVAFAPYDDPQIAVAIAIEKGGSGGALATSAVQIINAYFTSGNAGNGVTGENILLN